MAIYFAERCHTSFNPVVKSLLCSLYERLVFLRKDYLLESPYLQGRNEVGWRPGHEASLAPSCLNLRSSGSKSTVLKKVLVTLLGLFGVPAVILRTFENFIFNFERKPDTWTLISRIISRSAGLTNRSAGVVIFDKVQHLICVHISGNMCRCSTKYIQKTLCFDESKCKYVDEIDQDTPDSSASQFKEPGLNRKVSVDQGHRKAGAWRGHCHPALLKGGQWGRRCNFHSSIVCNFMVHRKIDLK